MLNIICLKHGTKYGPEYVNKLYNMIQRHLSVPHRFICFTDDPAGLNPSIEIRSIPSDSIISGWWWKPFIFKKDHFSEGDTNLFFDLDMVIVNNLDKFVDFMPDSFVGLEDLGRVFRKHPIKLGSAVMKWPAGKYHDIWDRLESNLNTIKTFRGDQDWIWHLHSKNIKFFPRDWIVSYKWEVRNMSELYRDNDRRFKFNTVKNTSVGKETSVLAFHGSPDPHEVMDPIIVDNWR
jgi:hypothetical protein